MNWLSQAVIGMAVALAFGVRADLPGTADKYEIILKRNAFGLKPPAVVQAPTPTQTVQKTSVEFTGITSDGASKRAWLMIMIPQPGKNPLYQSLSLIEGERQFEIEVLEINDKQETVKILNAGVPEVLTFATHGLKSKGAPAPIARPAPGAPQQIPGLAAIPVASAATAPFTTGPNIILKGGVKAQNPATPTTQTGAPLGYSGGTRLQPAPLTMDPELARRYGLLPATSPSQPTQPTIVSRNNNLTTIPTRNIRTQTPARMGGDPVVQHIQLRAQEIKAQQEGVPFPPIPPLPGAP